MFRSFLAVLTVVLLIACEKESAGPQYNFEVPAYFPAKHYNVPFNAKQFELGRKLFYDPILSENNTISCGSCHQQSAAFAHIDHRVSHGINGLVGIRNAPPMFNLAWMPAFMWDGGINHIETMPLAPITNPVEMDLPMADAVARLNGSAEYKALVKDAFGANTITDYHLFKALAMFMANIVSGNSRYDQYMQGKTSALNADEIDGLSLFTDKCASCHTPPLFTDFSYRNNGLDSVFNDTGRNHITQQPEDMGKFKVPSLRNVVLSYPYMHNGRTKTLDDVLDHYSSGIKQSATLDTSLQNGIPLTPSEKGKILAFLNALTDEDFVNNPAYAEPD
jgi:cytochrome c peroxidase